MLSDRFWPCRHIFFSGFELLENLRVLAKAVPGTRRMGEEGWPGANIDVWPLTVIPHQSALSFV